MRAGLFFVISFFLAIFAQAAPRPEGKRDDHALAVLDNLAKAAGEILSSDIEPILQSITPDAVSLFQEATSAVGSIMASNTALRTEATSLLSAVEAQATSVGKDLAKENGALGVRSLVSVSLGCGLVGALMSGYAVL
ncbi:hypothetical protein BD414DRAFT_492633 [Trametes punicea]|nr:hypothetical protein BD414DRAFT_492633 [Trametes punicea]